MKANTVFYIIAIALVGALFYAAMMVERSQKGKAETPLGSDRNSMAAGSNRPTGEDEALEVAEVGRRAPDFTLPDAQGNEHALSNYHGKYVVLEWVNPQCPFVRKHYDSGNMQKLQQTYRGKGVVWLAICSSAKGKQGYYEGEALTRVIESNRSNATAYLVDAAGTAGRRYGAKTTPHMFVINPKGVLLYAGAIDDKPSVRQSDIEAATNYVAQALDAATAGREVKTKSTKSYGCSVKY